MMPLTVCIPPKAIVLGDIILSASVEDPRLSDWFGGNAVREFPVGLRHVQAIGIGESPKCCVLGQAASSILSDVFIAIPPQRREVLDVARLWLGRA